MNAPYRIFSLVEMLNFDQRYDEEGEATSKAMGWMRANPGRWFIVGEIEAHPINRAKDYIGMRETSARSGGLDVEVLNNKVYARIPSPYGLPLSELVAKARSRRIDPLPMLQRDKFDWTLQELRNAASTAREWLGGSVGGAHGYAAA